jgi:hypothetical protein
MEPDECAAGSSLPGASVCWQGVKSYLEQARSEAGSVPYSMLHGFADRRRSHGRRMWQAWPQCTPCMLALAGTVGKAGAAVSDKGLVAGSLKPLDHGPALHLRMDLRTPGVQRKKAVILVGGRMRISLPPGRPRIPRPLSSLFPLSSRCSLAQGRKRCRQPLLRWAKFSPSADRSHRFYPAS